MREERRMMGEILFHGFCGAILLSLSVLSIQWWCLPSVNWNFVVIFGVIGFFFGAISGAKAIEFLKEIWWWS
jgi:hypothetical protein